VDTGIHAPYYDGGADVELGSIDERSYVSLTHWEADDYGVKAAIAVRDGDFAGAYDEVWFFRKDFAAFVQALREFSVAHKGEARLESMGPGEAVVSISRLDAAGHIRWRCRSHPGSTSETAPSVIWSRWRMGLTHHNCQMS
jgi:hypothetical protein